MSKKKTGHIKVQNQDSLMRQNYLVQASTQLGLLSKSSDMQDVCTVKQLDHLAQFYALTAQSVAQRTVIRWDRNAKAAFCKHCHAPFISSSKPIANRVSDRQRIKRNLRKQKICTITCSHCNRDRVKFL